MGVHKLPPTTLPACRYRTQCHCYLLPSNYPSLPPFPLPPPCTHAHTHSVPQGHKHKRKFTFSNRVNTGPTTTLVLSKHTYIICSPRTNATMIFQILTAPCTNIIITLQPFQNKTHHSRLACMPARTFSCGKDTTWIGILMIYSSLRIAHAAHSDISKCLL